MTETDFPQDLKKFSWLSILIVLLLAGAVVTSYRSAKDWTGTIVLPGGVTYLGPSQRPETTANLLPITELTCEKQFYNQVIGFAKYYLSVDGVTVAQAKSVNCNLTVSSSGSLVTTATAEANLKSEPSRGGNTFRCSSKALALTPEVPTKVDYLLKDDLGKTASCSATFFLSKP